MLCKQAEKRSCTFSIVVIIVVTIISIIAIIIIILSTIIGNRDITDMFPVTNCVCNDLGVPYMCDCG